MDKDHWTQKFQRRGRTHEICGLESRVVCRPNIYQVMLLSSTPLRTSIEKGYTHVGNLIVVLIPPGHCFGGRFT